ncbi:hypothetical protein [Halolamina sediminis]|jgi:hypothetical protein|uniref:hypothetical protein n=1 Tax=Halolamina sediminis TaxID=1480675 RepID=UPI0006B69C76|nr:hypothetical protein [Halolamina sediminis]
MASPLDYAIVVAYLLILVGIAVQYRRGALPRDRLLVLVGASLTWLSYGVLQLTQDGPISTGTGLNYVVDGAAVLLLIAGLYALYRWSRERNGDAG